MKLTGELHFIQKVSCDQTDNMITISSVQESGGNGQILGLILLRIDVINLFGCENS